MRAGKFMRLAWVYLRGRRRFAPIFLRIIPTDRCDLNCQYCFQHRRRSPEMTLNEFTRYVDHARSLGAGIVSFLGGEPLIWPHLDSAVAYCTRRRLVTDMTTNGHCLTPRRLGRLAVAGLDFLNLSVDTLETDPVSAKNALRRPGLLEAIHVARRSHGLRTRVNTVVFNNNIEQVKRIVTLCRANELPVSIGYVVPPLTGRTDDLAYLFTEKDRPALDEFIAWVARARADGSRIVDPPSYFTDIHRFLRGEEFWACNYPRSVGWLNVGPDGHIRSCTKKMDAQPEHILELTRAGIRALRSRFAQLVQACNPRCYSNCAYDGWYYARHRLQLIRQFL